MKFDTLIAALPLVLACTNALASAHDVDVEAQVPATLAVMHQDGAPLKSHYVLRYLPSRGIEPIHIPIMFVSNEPDAKMQVSVVSSPMLKHADDPTEIVSLVVRLDQATLSVNDTPVVGVRTADYPSLARRSLIIQPADPSSNVRAGHYEGSVTLRVSTQTASL